MNKEDIVKRFNQKLGTAISKFANQYNLAPEQICIFIMPREVEDGIILRYKVHSPTGALTDAKFEDIVTLDVIERAFISKKTIEEYIVNTLTKFSIATELSIKDFIVGIQTKDKDIQLWLWRSQKKLSKPFSVINLL